MYRGMDGFVCERVRVCVCVFVCVCARTCVRARAHVCVCVRACVSYAQAIAGARALLEHARCYVSCFGFVKQRVPILSS